MTAYLSTPAGYVLRVSIADAKREARDEAVEHVVDTVAAAESAAQFALMDCESEADHCDLADALLGLEQARNAAARMRGRA